MEFGYPRCYCVPDFHGEKCDQKYDECQLGPRCINGGTCIDGVDGFTCSCPPGISGMYGNHVEYITKLTNELFKLTTKAIKRVFSKIL